MLPSRGANQIRTGRSGDNRLLTCLEAQEAGYSFVRSCSRLEGVEIIGFLLVLKRKRLVTALSGAAANATTTCKIRL